MNEKMWTVARFPSGAWSTGGHPSDEEYKECEVFQVLARSRGEAKKKALSIRRYALKKRNLKATND